MNARELDKLILGILKGMQPISLENVWFEITENSQDQTAPSLQEVQERLQRMKKNKIVKTTHANRGKERYILAGK